MVLKKGFVAFLVLVGIVLNHSLFMKKEVVVSFNQQAVTDIEYQIFYTEYFNNNYHKQVQAI